MESSHINPGVSPLAGEASRASGTAQGSPADPSNSPMDAVLEVLRKGEKFLVCSHSRPDGDAVGSMLAMGMLLEQMGKRADLVTADRVPTIYRTLPGVDAIRHALRVHGPYDAVILLECDSLERTRLRGLEGFYLVNIDHHVSGRSFADLNLIDCDAASVGELVLRLVRCAGTTITPEMATCLYTTLLTDTGGFTYGSVGASTFEIARDLVLAGADPIAIAREVCFSIPTSKVLLLGAALNHLRREGRLAWLWVTHQDIVRSCAAEEDCEGIVNVAIGISGVEAAVFLRELPEGGIRLSLRSKGKVSVAAIAERFGGGGHGNAAGCNLEGPLSRATDKILMELRRSVASMSGE